MITKEYLMEAVRRNADSEDFDPQEIGDLLGAIRELQARAAELEAELALQEHHVPRRGG